MPDTENYGNVPGEGPLRQNGESRSRPVSKDGDRPSMQSSAVKRQRPALTLVRDLWGGTETVRNKGPEYLPQNPGESSKNYHARLTRSVFHNFFRRTVEGLTGLVFKKDPVLGDDVPAAIKVHWENIDLAGTHGDVFCRILLQDGLAAGHVCILVEYPDTDGTQTAADEMPGGIRPYWVMVPKDNIESYRHRVEAGRTILQQVVIRECKYVADGEYGEKEQVRYRVLYNEPGAEGKPGVVGYRLEEEAADGKTIIVVDEGTYPTQTEIPLAECVTSGWRGPLDSDPPCQDVAHLNVAHYQQWSDYARTLHMVVPFLFTAGVQIPEGSEVVVGPNAGLESPDAAGRAEYVSHNGNGIAEQKAALDDLKSDIGALGLAMLAPQKRAAETAEAKRLDKATSDSALAVAARGLQDGIERALGFHARYLKAEKAGSIQINRDFEGLLLEGPVMSAFTELVKAGFPPRVVLRVLQMGGRIPEDENLDEMEVEWLGAMAAQEAQRAMEREVQQQAMEEKDAEAEAEAA